MVTCTTYTYHNNTVCMQPMHAGTSDRAAATKMDQLAYCCTVSYMYTQSCSYASLCVGESKGKAEIQM